MSTKYGWFRDGRIGANEDLVMRCAGKVAPAQRMRSGSGSAGGVHACAACKLSVSWKQ